MPQPEPVNSKINRRIPTNQMGRCIGFWVDKGEDIDYIIHSHPSETTCLIGPSLQWARDFFWRVLLGESLLSVELVTPIGRHAQHSKQTVDFSFKMKEKHLQTCQLPDVIQLDEGRILERPNSWH
jgi:hypothetical protein